ncbi:Hypothetical predicted protein [Cloeon dipterum]|uniref:Dehydrogenase/reductase SDR family member 11 n=1 Tax=Cloeon dipterum TaxID=197152 RepID=A0A8S1C464_9INSE|nr:Hypothetical predicted protein [Cloeon dipterum]
MERWQGRVAIVTGASAGIGAAIVKLLAENGMKVVGFARRKERVEELAVEAKSAGFKGEIHAFGGDVRVEDDIKRAIQWTREKLGGPDVLVSNAGVVAFSGLTEIGTEDLKKVLDTNLVGACMFTREIVQDMKSRGVNDGHIFHINRFGLFSPKVRMHILRGCAPVPILFQHGWPQHSQLPRHLCLCGWKARSEGGHRGVAEGAA